MRKTIAIAVVAAVAATANAPFASAAPAAVASAVRTLQVDAGIEKVQARGPYRRRIVRRAPGVRYGGARIARGGRYYAGRGFRGRGYAPYYGRGFAPYYGYGYAPYYGYGYGGVGAAAGFLGLAAGLALGAAASNSYYGSPYYGGAAGVPAGRLYAPQTGCYVGAGDRVECPRY